VEQEPAELEEVVVEQQPQAQPEEAEEEVPARQPQVREPLPQEPNRPH
jgi:hypothetical protein